MQGSLMQRITNMEMLKLSHWNPAKDMLGVLIEIKEVLQRWARLDVMSVRNDRKYRNGSYLDIENYLLKLAMVCITVAEFTFEEQVKPHGHFITKADGRNDSVYNGTDGQCIWWLLA